MDHSTLVQVPVRSTHTEILESNYNKTEVQLSKDYYDFMQDDKWYNCSALYSTKDN